jgi:hypothetical protein
MGAVYRAMDTATNERVAIKVLYGHYVEQPEHAERFAREAQVLAELKHEGIVRYVAHGTTHDGEPWLTLEWLEGESLSDRLRRQGLTIGETIELGRRVADALAAAHERGVVHRDLKPSNLLLVDKRVDRVKVLDFGIAHLAGEATLTATGVVVGTPFYMAPEQARGDREVDARADVFALGCVLFHALTGRAPFASDEMHATLMRVVLEEAPRVSDLRDDVPPRLDALIAKMLQKAPDARPASGREVADALAEIAGHDLEASESGGAAIAITARERKVTCLLLVQAGSASAPVEARTPGATLPMFRGDDRNKKLREAVAAQKGAIEHLPGGMLVVTVPTSGPATDQAARIARCAFAVRRVMPEAALALVAGRGAATERRSIGDVFDRGMRLFEAPADKDAPREIRLDEVMAGLLDARFDVGGDEHGLFVRGERDVIESARTLLGKQTPCVGREHELSTLASAFGDCISQPGARAVLVTAPAGVGKSRLRSELLRQLARRSPAPQVWLAQGEAMSAGAPFYLLSQMLRREAGLGNNEPDAVREQKLRARLARHFQGRDLTRITEFVGALAGLSPRNDASPMLRAARADPMLMGDQMRLAWEDLVVAETQAGPLVLVLEDLHWGDLPTIKTIDATLRNLSDRPLLVLAFARPEVHDVFPRLWHARGLEEVRLRELSKKASERLVRDVLGLAANDDLVARIVDRAAGNAFYLEELIRAAAHKRPTYDAAGRVVARDAVLPETVLAMVEARLSELPSFARLALRAASIVGKEFAIAAIEPILGEAPGTDALQKTLNDLVDRELLAPRAASPQGGERRFAFRHALVREAAYATLTEQDRALGHRLAAEWLERSGERDAATIAEHFVRGREPERAATWYRRAAEQALEGNDFAQAILRAQRGAEHAKGDLLAALHMIELEAHKWTGDAASAAAAGAAAMRVASKWSPTWFAAAGESASMQLRLGNDDGIAALARAILEVDVERAIATPMPADRTDALVAALARAAASFLHAGQHDAALSLIAALDDGAAAASDRSPAVAARVHAVRASRALCMGDPSTSLYFTEQSLEAFLRAGDVRNACLVTVNAGHACFQLGQLARAERLLRDALAEAERIGLHNVAALARQNLGPVLALTSRPDEGLAVEREAIEAFVALSNRRQEGRSRLYLARILDVAGDRAAGLRECDAALDALAHVPPLAVFAHGVRADLLLHDDPKAALAAAKRAIELRDALGGIEEGEALVLLTHAEALLATGDRLRGLAEARAALDRLLQRAQSIDDTTARRHFLEKVPDNERTVKLSRSLGIQ